MQMRFQCLINGHGEFETGLFSFGSSYGVPFEIFSVVTYIPYYYFHSKPMSQGWGEYH